MFVYEPKEDSFLLIRAAKKYVKDKRVLDLCTGTGIVAIELKKAGAREVWGVDINPYAISYAKELAKKEGVKIKFLISDLFEKVKGKFDVITANPPYLPEDALDKYLDKWVKTALVGGEMGNEIILKIIKQAPNFLKEGGMLFIVFSSASHPEEIFYELTKSFKRGKIWKEHIMFEDIFVLQAIKI